MPNHCRWDVRLSGSRPSTCPVSVAAGGPMMMPIVADSISSTRGLAIDGDCGDGCSDGSDVWPHSGAISCHHRTTLECSSSLLWSAVRLPQIRSSLHKCLTPLTLLGPRVATLFQRPPSNIESHRLPITCSQIIAHVHGQRPLTCLHDSSSSPAS